MNDHPLRITPESRQTIKEPEEESLSPQDKYFYITPERTNLFMALARAQGEIDAASKTKENEYFTSKYSDIYDIAQAVKKPLAANDLFYSQMWVRGEHKNEVRIVTIVGHKSGEYMQIESSMICKDFENPQKMGSTISYAKRYQLAGLLGVTSTEKRLDDDANVVAMPDQSDAKVLAQLTTAAKKGQKSFVSSWKNLAVERRKGIRPEDLTTLKKLAEDNEPEARKPRVATSTAKNSNGK